MKTRDMGELFGIDTFKFENFLEEYHLEYSPAPLGGFVIEDDLVDSYVRIFLDVNADQKKKQKEIESEIEKERKRVRDLLEKRKETDFPIFNIKGCHGRCITVYSDRCIIKTNTMSGSILTDNAMDGSKTIFFKDVIGIQYKEASLLIGYLQLETSSNQMNNVKTNAFGENTFTFEVNSVLIEEMKDYVTYQISLFKQL